MEATLKSPNPTQGQQQATQLEITYFTDPLCCWSWGFEPHWRKLLQHYSGRLSYRYCMAGLLPDWKTYNDPLNSVSRPIQMGPVWMHASQVSGVAMQNTIWFVDPPASSYPACIAVKCAGLQSATAGEVYLSLVREAVMLKGQNIARTEVLTAIAEELESQMPGQFNQATFETDIHSDRGIDAFRADLDQVKLTGIDRYPSLLVRQPGNKAVLITGYKPFEVIATIIDQMLGG